MAVYKHEGLRPSGERKRGHVNPGLGALERNPLSLLENWNGALPETKKEAEMFLAWLRARREYSDTSLYGYLVEFRKLCLHAAKLGKHPRELDYSELIEPVATGVIKIPAAIKLYLRYLWEVTGEERYEKLYKRFRLPRRKKRLPTVLTREQVEKLLDECAREGLDLKVLVAVTYETGARVGEIIRLTIDDIVFDEWGAKLMIKRSKSQPRVLRVVLYAQLLAQYLELTRPRSGERIFPRAYRTYLTHLNQAWNRVGLPNSNRKFHILRHTRATELLKLRVFNEKEMMIWFGWHTRSMIDVYAHVTMQDAEQAYIAAMTGKPTTPVQLPQPQKCPRCSTSNPPEAKFCLKCGLPLESKAIEHYKESTLLQELLERIEKLERLAKREVNFI
ncbi:MAG: site-specific integrase [Thermofilaceae archaeon]